MVPIGTNQLEGNNLTNKKASSTRCRKCTPPPPVHGLTSVCFDIGFNMNKFTRTFDIWISSGSESGPILKTYSWDSFYEIKNYIGRPKSKIVKIRPYHTPAQQQYWKVEDRNRMYRDLEGVQKTENPHKEFGADRYFVSWICNLNVISWWPTFY